MRNVQDDLRDSLVKLKIVLETIEAQMRTDSKNNGLIDLAEIKKYQDELLLESIWLILQRQNHR